MMKWWGWGAYDVSFPMDQKPNLWPWARTKLGLEVERSTPPVERASLRFASPVMNDAFVGALAAAVPHAECSSSDEDRLHHAYGKSYPNLWRARCGDLGRLPDLVVRPSSREDVESILALAHAHEACVIPFGGGTNIVGGVDPLLGERRMIVCLDLRRMNRVVSVDRYAMTAVIQAGASGPELEQQLQKHGLSLGHFPDSFEYSTLGGWLATRSAGMQSDAYGRIEDMVVSVTMATPMGVIETRPVPASSAGPDLNRVVVGSEGVLGVIVEATMRVHAAPAAKDYRGLLFRSFSDGVAAIHDCLRAGIRPSMIRLQDEGETELAFRMKAPPKGLSGLLQGGVKAYLARSGYARPCIMVIGFEGQPADVRRLRVQALRVMKRRGAFPLGASVGGAWSKDKYNMPYLRDYIMDRGVMCDVSETSATWDKVVDVHARTIAAVEELFREEQGGHGVVGCHISHTYDTGACLYFTYAARQIEGRELDQYYRYKRRITDGFMQSGAALTHHHAVGTEHRPWMEQEVSSTGLRALRGLKAALDPKGIMNPGKLIPDEGKTAQPPP
ncbi:FAD-binding oxidoreductase [Alsobacter soli]|uniref:FAD-binding oxidoreductase n=1 Tax=Alsobacter soli TaxID=2109933 RepID=A0A2T1HY03_9HYPH|nr:FAD-binding oxidoreductase [Alsobacter soli]PSC06494.1 FAD-binding oxidoreductase [Alsobacter soli]